LNIETMGAIFETIHNKLTAAFSPTRLEIQDDSGRHAGHAGATPGGESHFNVLIEAEAFAGRPKVVRQRMVYKALADELAGPVHALSVKALAPGEPA
jgi:BolA family transcriptional regulator, general stress-responsive regulator